jgi:tRNA A-37 threonylcarbamoyl transferase component Bud32
MITERDRWVFDQLDKFDKNEESTDMDVDTFFDLMEEMVNEHYDAKEAVKHGYHEATRVATC